MKRISVFSSFPGGMASANKGQCKPSGFWDMTNVGHYGTDLETFNASLSSLLVRHLFVLAEVHMSSSTHRNSLEIKKKNPHKMIRGTSLLSWDDMKRVWLCMCGLDKYKTNITIIQEHTAQYKSFPGHLLRHSRLSGYWAVMEGIGQASTASPHLHLQSNSRQAIWLLAATCQSTSTSEKTYSYSYTYSLFCNVSVA